jgi:hypothetical protein
LRAASATLPLFVPRTELVSAERLGRASRDTRPAHIRCASAACGGQHWPKSASHRARLARFSGLSHSRHRSLKKSCSNPVFESRGNARTMNGATLRSTSSYVALLRRTLYFDVSERIVEIDVLSEQYILKTRLLPLLRPKSANNRVRARSRSCAAFKIHVDVATSALRPSCSIGGDAAGGFDCSERSMYQRVT